MYNKNFNRRNFLQASAAILTSSATPGLVMPMSLKFSALTLGGASMISSVETSANPRVALFLVQALMPVISAMLTSKVQAASTLEAAKIQAAAAEQAARIQTASAERIAQIRVEQAKISAYRAGYSEGLAARQLILPILESRLWYPEGDPVNYRFMARPDRLDTELALNGGFAHVARGGYADSVSAEELRYLVTASDRYGVMPVPVSGYRRPNDSEADAIRSVLGNQDTLLPCSVRLYSSARRPTSAGWDTASALYLNGASNNIGLTVLGRQELVRS